MCNRFTHFKRCLFVVTLLISIPSIPACKKPQKIPITQKKKETTNYVMFSNVKGMEISHLLKNHDELNKIAGVYKNRRKKFDEFDIIYFRDGVDMDDMVDLQSKYVFGSHDQCSTLE